MTSISFQGHNDRIQVGINEGSINSYISSENRWQDYFRGINPLQDMRTLKRKKGGPTPGTCEWVLRTEELTAWPDGTGKSTIALYLTEELSATFFDTDGKMLAYFFCDSAFDTRKTATSVVKGLLYQLVQQHEELRNYLLSKYHTHGEGLFASFDDLWDIFMTMVADQNTGRKYCIIDALDECDRESQDTLLQQLEETFNSPNVSPNVRILVTSRPHPEIRESLQMFPNKDLASFPQRQKDMDIFVEEKVNSLAQRKRYTQKVKAEVRRVLQDKAEGTFLWIGLACGELKDIPSNSVVRTLQNIPKGLVSLFQQLLETALKQSEVSGDDIRHLLSCVAISSRPLTVSELSEACQLHQEEEDIETRLQFTHEYIESCRLMVIIQNEKVHLLHKSIRDYLVGGSSSNFTQELQAHAQLAYRCVDRVIAQFRDIIRPKSSFWYYASQQWAHHARMAESCFTVQSSQAEFFQIHSPCREWWLENLRSETSFLTVPKRFSIFHVAVRWGICALVNHAAELEFQDSDVERTTFTDHVNCTDDSDKTPLEYAARSGFPNVADALLNRGGKVTTEVVSAAARNGENGKAVMALLLDRCGDEIIITEEVIKAAAGNQDSGEAVMALLLGRYGDEITITEEVVKAAAGNWRSGEAVMALLLDRCGDEIIITEEVIKATAGNHDSGEAVMVLLLNRRGDEITITEEVVKAAAGNWRSGEAVMVLLLNHRGDKITITEEVVKAAAGNWRSGEAVMALLLDRCGDEITITKEVVKAAAENQDSGEAVMALLLDRCGDEITITEGVVKAAAENQDSGKAVMALLLDRRGDEITITEEVVKAAAGNWRSGEALIVILLNCCGDEITITKEVVKAAAGNPWSGKAVLELLLNRCGDQIIITEGVVKVAAINQKSGEEWRSSDSTPS